ncbi:hypothetical protein SESBI_42653 [Sesbania bispinosa]|nr:hypothetical protein SESBI_42653 [Sesbania bispinosa]
MEPEPEFFLTLILHHGGKFVKDVKNGLEYVGGEIDVWEGLDVDTMCLWTPFDLCKEHGYVRFDNIWWHNPDFDLEKGLRPLAEDLDIRQMCNIGKVRDWEMHIYFEHPIDTPEISQKEPNDASIDEDLRKIVDDIVRMTMAPHFVEDDGSEDIEVVHESADQINVQETESDSGVGGIEVEGAVGEENTTTNHENFTEFEGAAGANMGEDDGGKETSDEDRSYEASEESSGDDYESASDSPYRPPLFQSDDEYEEESAVPRRMKRVGSNVASSGRQRRQADNDGSGGSGGTGGSLDGGVGENMAAGEEHATTGLGDNNIIVVSAAEGDPATKGAAAPAVGAKPATNDDQATEINLSQSSPLSQGIQDYEIQPSQHVAPQTVNEMPNLELPAQSVVRPPPVRPSGMVMPTASRIPVRAPIHTCPPPSTPPAARLGSPASMPPPTKGVSQDTFEAGSRGLQ